LRANRGAIAGRRFTSAAAASGQPGIQVCNVVVHKKPGASPQLLRRAVNALQANCSP
jgi:hypothetical protein